VIILEKEKVRKARIKRQGIILQTYDALKGLTDPNSLDVGELVGELKGTRDHSPELSDISTGVSVIRVLNLLREKQDEIPPARFWLIFFVNSAILPFSSASARSSGF